MNMQYQTNRVCPPQRGTLILLYLAVKQHTRACPLLVPQMRHSVVRMPG